MHIFACAAVCEIGDGPATRSSVWPHQQAASLQADTSAVPLWSSPASILWLNTEDRWLFTLNKPADQWQFHAGGGGAQAHQIVASPPPQKKIACHQIVARPPNYTPTLQLLTHCVQFILRKIGKFDATRCQIFEATVHKFRFPLGLHPRPRWESLQHPPPDPPEVLLLRGVRGNREGRGYAAPDILAWNRLCSWCGREVVLPVDTGGRSIWCAVERCS